MNIEEKAKRFGAAFQVHSWGVSALPGRVLYFGTSALGEAIHFETDTEQSVFWSIEIGEGNTRTQLFVCLLDGETSLILDNPQHKCILAQGLYCLGFDEPNILNQIALSLTMHEKTECHHRMPRDLWPETWTQELVQR